MNLLRRLRRGEERARTYSPPIDVEALLRPIEGAKPSGEFLRFSNDFLEIEESRKRDDPSLPVGVWQRTLKTADWDRVIHLCQHALVNKTKDLLVACWLLEALGNRYGNNGLAAGFEVVTGLCEHFWDDLHPQLDEDGAAGRIAAIAWLDEKVPEIIFQSPVVTATDTETIISWADYVNSQRYKAHRLQNPDGTEGGASGGALASSDIHLAIEATSDIFYIELADALDRVNSATTRCESVFDKKCRQSVVGLTKVRSLIAAIRNFASIIVSQRLARIERETEKDQQSSASNIPLVEWHTIPEESVKTDNADVDLRIHNRQEAYRILSEIAVYLHQIEPHSPTPYLIDKAVQWGSMPLNELVQNLSHKDNHVFAMWDLLGLDSKKLHQLGRHSN